MKKLTSYTGSQVDENISELKKIDFQVFPSKIMGKARARVCSSGYAYTPKTTKDAEEEIVFAFNECWINNWQKTSEWIENKVALFMDLLFVIEKPKSSKNKYPIVKPDLDNMVKLVCDSLNGYAYHDDSQICELQVRKIYGEQNRIDIHIEEHFG